jgi:Uncharacterized protein conserved in bacteria
MTEIPPAPAGNPIAYGAAGRCPRCGKGRLFDGYLTIAERCSVCGLNFGGHDAGDGPAVFGIFILGFLIVGIAGYVEYQFSPPLWVHAVVWLPLTLAGTLVLLRPLKGIAVALQYRYRSVEEPERPGGT